MYRMIDIWEQAVKEERENCGNYIISRSFHIENVNGEIIIRRFIAHFLKEVSSDDILFLKEHGWVVGTIKLSVERMRLDLEKLNHKIRREMNGRRNKRCITGLNTKRAECFEVYSRLLKQLNKAQISTAQTCVEKQNTI